MKAAALQALLDESGMNRFMGVQLQQWDAEQQQLTLRMPARNELQGGAGPGHFHGGAVGALIDTATTYAVLATGVTDSPTVSYRVDLLRPATGAALVVRASVRRIGRTLATVDAEVEDDQQRLVALGRATLAVRG